MISLYSIMRVEEALYTGRALFVIRRTLLSHRRRRVAAARSRRTRRCAVSGSRGTASLQTPPRHDLLTVTPFILTAFCLRVAARVGARHLDQVRRTLNCKMRINTWQLARARRDRTLFLAARIARATEAYHLDVAAAVRPGARRH